MAPGRTGTAHNWYCPEFELDRLSAVQNWYRTVLVHNGIDSPTALVLVHNGIDSPTALRHDNVEK